MKQDIDLNAIRHLYSFRSHFLDRGGLNYHYIDEGQGDPVVMVHGNPTWSFYYRALINSLSSHFRTIAPDHIGCGLSDKPGPDRYDYRFQSRVEDLEALLDHLALSEKITLIVHDWGGAIGLAAAVRNPDRIARLVILNTAAFPPPGNKPIPPSLWFIRNLAPLAGPLVMGLNLFARSALHLCSKKGLAPDVKKGLIAPYNNWNNRRATFLFVRDIPLKPGDPGYKLLKSTGEGLARLRDRPMLILWGGRDFVFDSDYYQEWKRRFPEAEALFFPQAGHYILEDEPIAVTEAVRRFLMET